MGLHDDTLEALKDEYVLALVEEKVLSGKDEKLAIEIGVMAGEIRDNKKQITSLRAILKSNGVDVKDLGR